MRAVLILMLLVGFSASALVKKPAKRQAKNMSFDNQLVEGEVYRPDYSVVTGEAPGEGWGVLRLRRNFNDHSRTDAKETSR